MRLLITHRALDRTAFTIRELLAGLCAATILMTIVLPSVASSRNGSRVETSMANLMAINVGQFMYAMDWNERQFAFARDELGYFGSDAIEALTNHEDQVGDHPGIRLGWNEDGLWQFPLDGGFITANASLVVPVQLDSRNPFGNLRLVNAKGFHDYVTGRYYDPVYYPPNDEVPFKTVSPFFETPDAYIPSGKAGGNFWSSYCLSAAAWYDPDVFRAPSAGGYQDPFELGYGLETPSYTQVLHPDLKTLVMEHHWNQNPPAPCNPAVPNGTYDDCEPYYFNHGIDSSPVALFYDGHIRLFPNQEAFDADAQVMKQSGGIDGLWSRDTPLGEDGYYGDISFDGTRLSHHVLTTDGIRGRDTLTEQ